MPHGEVEWLIIQTEFPYSHAAEPGPGLGTIRFNDGSRGITRDCGHIGVQSLHHPLVDIGRLSEYIR